MRKKDPPLVPVRGPKSRDFPEGRGFWLGSNGGNAPAMESIRRCVRGALRSPSLYVSFAEAIRPSEGESEITQPTESTLGGAASPRAAGALAVPAAWRGVAQITRHLAVLFGALGQTRLEVQVRARFRRRGGDRGRGPGRGWPRFFQAFLARLLAIIAPT